jgi:hypothetical protein
LIGIGTRDRDKVACCMQGNVTEKGESLKFYKITMGKRKGKREKGKGKRKRKKEKGKREKERGKE